MFKFLVSRNEVTTQEENLCLAVLRFESLRATTEFADPAVILKLRNGVSNPDGTFVITVKDTVILGFWDLIKYINENGLRQC